MRSKVDVKMLACTDLFSIALIEILYEDNGKNESLEYSNGNIEDYTYNMANQMETLINMMPMEMKWILMKRIVIRLDIVGSTMIKRQGRYI